MIAQLDQLNSLILSKMDAPDLVQAREHAFLRLTEAQARRHLPEQRKWRGLVQPPITTSTSSTITSGASGCGQE
jgi:hypothetical protein